MAIEKNIVIGADLSGLERKLDELIDALKASQKQADKTAEAVNDIADTSKDIGKNAEESKKGVKALSTGFKGLGMAMKAAGIGLVIEAMNILKELFDNNQKVVDAFNTSFNFLQIMFSEVSGVIEDLYNNVSQSSDNFDALGRVLKNIMTIALTPMQLSFQGIKAGILGAQLAWEQSWLGGNDEERIEDLKTQLGETKDKIVELGKGAFESGKGVIKDFKEAAGEVANIGTQVVSGLGDISVKSSFQKAKAMTELNKEAELADAKAQGLIEKYDRQAERIRQVRDDDKLSIQERITANEELGAVLDEQEKTMLANAKTKLAKANQDLALAKDNVEFQKAQIEATNELAAIEAQIDGFRSEYKMNQNALEREAIDLQRSKAEGELEVAEIEGQVAIDAETNLLNRINLEEELSKKLYEDKLAQLEAEKLLYKENTQSYQDMVNEINALNAERTTQEAEEGRNRENIERQVQDAKVQMVMDGIGAINGLVQAFAGENEKAQKRAFMINKVAGIANAVISTAAGITKALEQTTDPTPTQSFRFANAAIVGATGAAQIATIARQQFSGGGSVDTNIPDGGGGNFGSMTPQFNVVGSTGTNAILQSLQQNPVKAYVVGSDVTSQQELDRNRIKQSTF